MGKFIIILLLCVPVLSYGQGFSAVGNTNPTDTARILNNWFLPIKGLRMPFYANNDTNFLLIRPTTGYVVKYSLNQLITRVNASAGVSNLQQVTTAGNTTTLPIFIGQYLSIAGNAGDGVINADNLSTDRDIDLPNNSGTLPIEINGYTADVNGVVSIPVPVIFDTVMSATVTSLTSLRFSRTVKTITYAGITYNSDYWTQVAATINFIGLTFYNGQKLTITLY